MNFAGKHNAVVAFNYYKLESKLDGKILATTSFKYLGVQITDNFSWDLHVDSVTSTAASQRLGIIKRILFDAPKR